MNAHGIEAGELSSLTPDLRERAVMFMGRQLQTVMPIAERMIENRGLTVAATAFLCSVAMLGVPESSKAAETPLNAGVGPVATQTKPGVNNQEIVIPSHLVPSVNQDCGDPSYRAPEDVQKASMLCRFNNARLTPLVEDSEMEEAAEAKADDLLDCDHISHQPCTDNEDPFKHTKEIMGTEGTWFVGEDIAYGEGVEGKVRAFYNGWRWSRYHWHNIMNKRFTKVGFAIEHVKQRIMDVDLGDTGFVIKDRLMRNTTILVAVFWGPK